MIAVTSPVLLEPTAAPLYVFFEESVMTGP